MFPLTLKVTVLGTVLLLLLGCSPNSLPSPGYTQFANWQPASPVDSKLDQPANDFALIFEYGACGTDRLDTFRGDFTQDRLVESPITTPITITLSDKISIYQKTLDINFFSYPAHYTIPPAADGSITQVIPATHYLFIVRNQDQTKTVEWLDNIVEPKTVEAERLRELAHLLIDLIKAKPEVKRLPELTAGCT